MTSSEMLARYLQAEADVLAGKTISFGGRTLSSENLAEIRKGRAEWERRVAAERSGGGSGSFSYSVARFDGQ